jgi:histidinol-phosphate aminotransferase
MKADGSASWDELRVHGDRMVTEGHLDFAVNVVPGGPPSWLVRELADELGHVSLYPDESQAIGALSQRHGRPSSNVLVTNGAAEAFWLVATALRPRHAVVIHPGFTEAEVALRSLGRPLQRAFRDPDDFALDPSVVSSDADVVFVCNPNNPTGSLDTAEVLRRLVRPGRVLVIDEAFMEFCEGETESLASHSGISGVIVIRSITKLWSVPGIRAGYMLGPPGLIDRLRSVRQPWPVNSLALVALTVCARRQVDANERARAMAHASAEMIEDLRGIPAIRTWPSVTNFVLIEVPDGAALLRRLGDKGLAVRRADTFPGLSPNHLRVTVRRPEDNRLLVAALREFFE